MTVKVIVLSCCTVRRRQNGLSPA